MLSWGQMLIKQNKSSKSKLPNIWFQVSYSQYHFFRCDFYFDVSYINPLAGAISFLLCGVITEQWKGYAVKTENKDIST